MARMYALLQPDGSLLTAKSRGSGWVISGDRKGIESRGRNLTVFLNGLDVLGLTAIIPARTEKEARRAAPFAVEDEIAEGVEDSHVALSAPDKSDPAKPRLLNIISAETLSQILAALSAQGLDEADLVAAHSLLPIGDVLYEAPGLVLGRLGERSFALDASLGSDVLIGLTEAHPEIAVYGDRASQALGRPSSGKGATSLEAFLTQLATWAESGRSGVNLRQGAFEARRPVDLEGFAQWKLAGILAAFAAIGWFANVLIETNAMNTRTASLNTLSEEFARVGWPELNGDVQQVLSITQDASGASGQPFPSVLDTSAALYEAMTSVEGVELRTLRYDRLRRQMTATIAFQSFADVDRLTAMLNETNLTARSGDARQSGSKVIGELTLEAGS